MILVLHIGLLFILAPFVGFTVRVLWKVLRTETEISAREFHLWLLYGGVALNVGALLTMVAASHLLF